MSSDAASGASPGWAIHRSVTLLRVFLLASAGILVTGGLVLTLVLTGSLRQQALDDAGTSLTQYVDGVLRPQIVRGNQIHVSPRLPQSIKQQLRRQPDLITVKVWPPDAALALLVRRASQTLQRQASALRTRSKELMESYRRLEESSLEAIESLNATVDAKDPYTAGHSARVQRVALAVAEELGIARQKLDAVRFGGLFHDIGKIGVPDSILTKPGRLDEEEFALIQRHPADGAEIVSHFSRLHQAVPLIRHHHERWDGKGYPDRLAGEQIPLEACVVGLADAWDAMTTDRPYRGALTLEEAAAEVRNCRGTQFAPSVVDAFFTALRRRPDLFEPDE